MGKVKSFVFIVVAIMLVISACSPTAETPANDADLPSADIIQLTSSSTPAAATATTESSITQTESPTEVPPTPTSTPAPVTPSGTLSLVGQYGYGTGYPFSGRVIQLTEDEQSLIVTTSAGIFTFSAQDLSPQVVIHEPFGMYPYYRNIRISRDGTQAVVFTFLPTGEKVLRVWDLTTGDLLNEYTIDEETSNFGYVMEIAISLDNQHAVLVDEEGMILVLNLADGTVVIEIEDYVNNTMTPMWLEFDSNGKNVYYIFTDITSLGIQSVGINSTSWQEASIHSDKKENFPWVVGVFSPQLSSSGYEFGYFTKLNSETIAAVDYTTFGPRFKIDRTDRVYALAFSPDGAKVAMAGTNPAQLEVWKVDTIKAPEEIFNAPKKLWSVAVTSDGKSSFGVDVDGTLYKWQSGQSEPVASRKGFWPLGTGIEFADDGQTLRLFTGVFATEKIATSEDYDVFEFESKNGDLKGRIPNPYFLEEMKKDVYPQSIALSPDKTLMAVIYDFWIDDDIRLFDYTTGKLIKKIKTKIDFDNIDFTPDGKSLVGYGRLNNPIQVIDLNSGKVLNKFPVDTEFENDVDEMRLSGDKATMVLASGDGYLKAYKTDTFELIQAMDESASAWSFTISNDGSRVAYLTWDGKIGLWDIPSNTLLSEYELSGYPDLTMTYSFPSLAFSPDNKQLALSTPDGIIRVFDVAP